MPTVDNFVDMQLAFASAGEQVSQMVPQIAENMLDRFRMTGSRLPTFWAGLLPTARYSELCAERQCTQWLVRERHQALCQLKDGRAWDGAPQSCWRPAWVGPPEQARQGWPSPVLIRLKHVHASHTVIMILALWQSCLECGSVSQTEDLPVPGSYGHS